MTLKLHLQVAVHVYTRTRNDHMYSLCSLSSRRESPTRLYIVIFGYVDKKGEWFACSLSHIMFVVGHARWMVFMVATRLISSKKSVYDLMGTYSIGSTKHIWLINEPCNETAAAKDQWNGDQVGSRQRRQLSDL